jgi:hypothetical protein
MKAYYYMLSAALGAAAASWGTYRVVKPQSPDFSVAAGPSIAFRPVATTLPGPNVESAAETALERDRLAHENAELKAQLDAAYAQLVDQNSALNRAKEQLDDFRRPLMVDVLSSTLRAELKSGEVVVTGGYPLADGRRLYAFAKPIAQDVDGAGGVRIEGHYLTLTDEVSQTVGLDSLATNAANTLQHGEVWLPGEDDAVLVKIQNTPGADVVVYPDLAVQFGRSGTISVGDVRIKVTPSRADSGDGLGLELRLEQPQPSPDNAPNN